MSSQLSATIGLLLVLVLAVSWLVARRETPEAENVNLGWDDLNLEEFFVEADADSLHLAVEDWRWKVGDEAEVYRVTVFGDLFTQAPEGTIYWLDTGSARYVEVAKSADHWQTALREHWREWLHWSTLRELRDLNVGLDQSHVFSWIQYPMLGGSESVNNIDFVPLTVHVSHSGRVAKAIQDLPPGTKIENVRFRVVDPEGTQEDTIYEVVTNEEMQYSIWPSGEDLPSGWIRVGKTGTKQECLDYIATVWTDMRPLSLRKQLEEQ